MSITRKLARPLAVLAATAAVTVTLAAPAFANAGVNVGTDVNTTNPTRQVIPAVQIVLGNRNPDLQTRNIVATCQGASIGDAVATRVTECALWVNLVRATNEPLALPGVLIASASTSQLVPVNASVYACATVSAIWSDSTASVSRRVCTSAQITL